MTYGPDDGMALICFPDDLLEQRIFGHVDHGCQTARDKDCIISTNVYI